MQRLEADMSINYHMWLHYYTTHSAQPPLMYRHLQPPPVYLMHAEINRVQSPTRQYVVIGCRYIHIHKSLSHAQNTQYCMHVQACTLVYTEMAHCMHYGHDGCTTLRTYCTTHVMHYGRTAAGQIKDLINAGRIGARWHDV